MFCLPSTYCWDNFAVGMRAIAVAIDTVLLYAGVLTYQSIHHDVACMTVIAAGMLLLRL